MVLAKTQRGTKMSKLATDKELKRIAIALQNSEFKNETVDYVYSMLKEDKLVELLN